MISEVAFISIGNVLQGIEILSVLINGIHNIIINTTIVNKYNNE